MANGRGGFNDRWNIGMAIAVVAMLSFAGYAAVVSLTRDDSESLPMRVAAFGDSLTAPRDGWLDTSVGRAGGIVVENASVPGSQTSAYLDRIVAVDESDPNVVVILGGTNDVAYVPVAQTIANITAIGDHYASAGDRVVLATIPPRDVDAPQDRPRVDALNSQIVSLAGTRGWSLIDFHAVLANGDQFIDGLTEDGIHPIPEGVKMMADAAVPVLSSARSSLG